VPSLSVCTRATRCTTAFPKAAATTIPMRSGEFQFHENGLCSSTRPETQLVTVPDRKLVGVPAGPM
jgi:hypothetical protein